MTASSRKSTATYTSHSNDEQQLVRTVIAAFGDAFARRDVRAFSMVFHDDADFTNVAGARVVGRKAIEEFHRPLLEGDGAGTVPSFKHAELEILDTRIRFLRDDIASVDVDWRQTGAVQYRKRLAPRIGLLMLVVTKEAGSWGIAVMHNMDLPGSALHPVK